MKTKIILLSFFAVFIGGILGLFYNSTGAKKNLTKSVPKVITVTPKPKVEPPARLKISKLSLDVPVESVELDTEKRMDVPKNVQNVAWYNLGPKPGEIGNAVIDGHVDTQTGAPAVFYKLKTLKNGDIIAVTAADGKEYTYTVSNVTAYPVDTFPIQEVFGSTSKSRLNLITCGGVWDKAKKEYTERTVVYSELNNSSGVQ